MKFNADGYLEPGFHDMTIENIEEHFVRGFTSSTTRPVIIEGYKRHKKELQETRVNFEQFFDGSFASTKNDPSDIDLVCFADADEIDSLSDAQKLKLSSLFAGKATKATHNCDAYFVAMVPETHPNYQKVRSTRKYWMGEFGYDRLDCPKGIVRTQIEPDEEES